MDITYSAALKDFDAELAQMHMRGQWLFDPARRDNTAPAEKFGSRTEPKAAGVPHLWRWKDVYPKLERACEALPESYTARRALAFKNPELPRCTAHTLNMAIQVIRPGEIAWAHRHTIAAIRFVITGNAKLVTVVDGVAYRMEENDLILTPSWSWHDHRNESDEMTCWLDVLDVPFVGGLNMGFYEELGDATQPVQKHFDGRTSSLRPLWTDARESFRGTAGYPWRETREVLRSFADVSACPHDGAILEYADQKTGGPTLPTLSCQIQRLPPGFSGQPHRHTSSAVYHVVSGEGTTEADDQKMDWSFRDSFVVPNWTWHRHVNRSSTTEAIVFSVTDAPALQALGFYREEAREA